jgi:hypothetical protein
VPPGAQVACNQTHDPNEDLGFPPSPVEASTMGRVIPL